ncbi:phosphoenolpyruvate--protein phosphotransferase [Halobacteriovorax marinus]|uniref:Phosphoenolpyruvate-protein phosphotransferase n=1 Tax=Halobacteriovorax marinus TaxID=97084 RepID=A0A1Y5F352_9BACT|nr:phosphoenolpyruvate--protein phosphotransferase [Halobacteriovorax marinus]
MIGKSASPGFAYGKIVILEDVFEKVVSKTSTDIDHELSEFERISKIVVSELEELSKNATTEDQTAIFEAHSMLAADPSFKKDIVKLINEKSLVLSCAVKETALSFMAKFEALDDDYFKERALDIKDVASRFLTKALNINSSSLRQLDNDVVLIAKDITPSQTAQIDKDKVRAFITEVGGITSHTAIIARTLEIPAIVGARGILESAANASVVAIDGLKAEIFLDPSNDLLEKWDRHIEDDTKYKEMLFKYIDAESVTEDGHQLSVLANISSVEDTEAVLKNGGEGIGLLRTEFLFMEHKTAPSEESQFEFYKKIALAMGDRPVTIRTLDIGGDKEVDYLGLDPEDNPFLGYRAIRICLDREDLFKPQLRAILRASDYGNLKIMFPMIATHNEIIKAKEILETCKKELHAENISFDPDIKIGIMIEIPAAAVMSDVLAEEVDFFSIGTNDLIQYTIAVDRMNDKLSNLYSYFDPSVIRLINMTIEGANKAGIPVGMCGSMASELQLTELLIGLGLDSFSVTSGSILSVRKNIIIANKDECHKLVPSVLAAKDKEEVLKIFSF